RPAAAAARAQGAAAAGRGDRKLRARRRAARPHPGARMIDLSLLPDGGMGWLDASGPKGSIVLSTRIRLARNLEGYVFSQRAKDADRSAVLTRVEEASAASDLLQGAVTIRLDQLERVDRQLLHERHLVSKELAGLDREGSEVVGNFFQLSNQTTLGKTEDELLDHLGKIVRQVIEYEEQARDVLLRTAPDEVADKTWRAYGLLKYARKLTFEETMNLLSGVRLGVGLNLIPSLSVYTLNKLLIFTQPAHLAALEGRQGGDPELPTVRAT